MRSLRAALAASLAALALLAGCSDDDPFPGDPPSTGTPTGTPETPTSSAAPPTEPEVATQQTRDGAEEFARYYWQVVNHALASGDTAPLRATLAKGCAACEASADWIDQIYQRGGSIQGGEFTVTNLKSVKAPGPIGGWDVTVTTKATRQVVSGAGDLDATYDPGEDRVAMTLRWQHSGWEVTRWDSE